MAHCTECGAELRAADKFCGGCGTALSFQSVPEGQRDDTSDQHGVATLMGMAKTAELGSNYAEALQYYNRALEVDPTIVEAWVGKGKAASWQSTLANFRVSEGVIAFQHAISNSAEDRQHVVDTVVDELNRIVTALYRMAHNHLEEYASLDHTWASYLNQVAQMLDALEQALKWAPRNKMVLENIVHLTRDNIEGYKYWDNINRVSGLHSITPEYEKTLRGMMDQSVAALHEIDENYVAPTVEKKQAGACFVVTATMGDARHPDVMLLRRFRDDWLSKRSSGRLLISCYYHAGPRLAAWIERRPLRRRIAYLLIVRPAVLFALNKVEPNEFEGS